MNTLTLTIFALLCFLIVVSAYPTRKPKTKRVDVGKLQRIYFNGNFRPLSPDSTIEHDVVTQNLNEVNNSKTPAVFGGHDASQTIADFVSRVRIFRKNGKSPHCTGFVVSEDQVLTNAHCVYYKGKSVGIRDAYVWVGHREPSSMTSSNRYQALSVHVSKGYTKRTGFRDCAIITIQGYFPSSQKIAGLSRRSLPPGTLVSIAGYGYSDSDSTALQTTEMEFVADRNCKYPSGTARSVLRSQRCFTTPSGASQGQTGCFGDSGGPVFYISKRERMWVYAMHTYRRGRCGVRNTLSIGMDMRYFRSSIEEMSVYEDSDWNEEYFNSTDNVRMSSVPSQI